MNKKYLFLASFLIASVLAFSLVSAGIFDFLSGNAVSDVSNDRGERCSAGEPCDAGVGDCRGRVEFCTENAFCARDFGPKYGYRRGVDVCECMDGYFAKDGFCVKDNNWAGLGDVNVDGVINSLDVNLISNHVAGLSLLYGEDLILADLNKDGQVDVVDLQLVSQLINSQGSSPGNNLVGNYVDGDLEVSGSIYSGNGIKADYFEASHDGVIGTLYHSRYSNQTQMNIMAPEITLIASINGYYGSIEEIINSADIFSAQLTYFTPEGIYGVDYANGTEIESSNLFAYIDDMFILPSPNGTLTQCEIGYSGQLECKPYPTAYARSSAGSTGIGANLPSLRELLSSVKSNN